MRINLFASGLIDDMAGDVSSVVIRRVGDSRYSVLVTALPNVHFQLWTTRKDRVRAIPRESPPAWVTLALGSSDELEFLAADDCALHLEHLDRGLYFLGLSRDCDDWGVNLQAHGYIKTKILPNETGAA